ncbi:MAG: baseplate J/gp47 family protein [Eubacteriales bacterium]|nr:baseplate J/gp47 family protein [Eubacteriales bacterium]
METIQKIRDSIPEVSFIEDKGLNQIQSEMINDFLKKYKDLTGKDMKFSLADPVRMMLSAAGVQIYQALLYVDRAGKQNLLKYSYAEFLDSLAAWVGISRMQPIPAVVTIRFTLSEARETVIGIPSGTRVTNRYELYYDTEEYAEISVGDTYVDVKAVCETPGIVGNKLEIGEINVLVDPIPYMDNVRNIDKPSGGADIESDDSLAERIYMAPSRTSVAGPKDAYVYWARAYHSEIGDVSVVSPRPVEVVIRFLMSDSSLPDEHMIDGLQEYLQDKNIRPLTDKVTVQAPEIEDYNLNVRYWINRSDYDKAAVIQSKVFQAIEEYKRWQSRVIGRDINPDELIRGIKEAGAKRAEVQEPVFRVIPDTSVARLVSENIAYGGIEDD